MLLKKSRRYIWTLFDPLLLKVASRLRHLESLTPPDYSSPWRSAARFDETARFSEEANIKNYGRREDLSIGNHSHIRGELSIIAPGGRLHIGHHCYVGPGTRIWAQSHIEIGNYVLISHLVDIHDSNAHSTDAGRRRSDAINLFEKNLPLEWENVESRPVRIEDDAWIGFKSSLLKGVVIGRGAVVAAGSMVTKDVAPYTLVAGNPARIVRELVRSN